MGGDSMGINVLDNYLYDGQEIADRGNIVFVSVAYRVGVLGFLSTGDSSLPGANSFNWNAANSKSLYILLDVANPVTRQETTACGTSTLPSPGCTETSARLLETQETSPSLESLQAEQALTTR